MKNRIVSLILIIVLISPQPVFALAPSSGVGEAVDLVGLLSHRFPKHIREALVSELEEQGYAPQDISKAIWRGLTWTDGTVIGFKDDALFNIAAGVLSKILRRPISADTIKAVLEYHEEIHRRFHSEKGCVKRLQDELSSTLGSGRYRKLLEYFQNQYGEYKDEMRLVEELAVNLYVERLLGNPLRLLDEYNNVVVLEEINPIIETHTKDILDRIDIKNLRFGNVLNDLYIERFTQPEPEPERPPEPSPSEPVRPPEPERPPTPRPPEPVRPPRRERPPEPPRLPQRPVPEVRPGMQVKIIGSEVLGVGTVISLEGNTIVIEFPSGRKELVWAVVKTRIEVVTQALSPQELWERIVELDNRINSAGTFRERTELMAERNRYRQQLWELLQATRTGKYLQWAKLTRTLGIDEVQLRKAIWDYFVETANGDIDKIIRLSGFARSLVDVQIGTNVGMRKVHLVRALAKAGEGKELLEGERQVMLRELIERYLTDPTFPDFLFKTRTIPRQIEKGRAAVAIHLVQIGDKPIIMLEGLEQTFGPDKEVTIKTIFDPDYGWLFETSDESGVRLFHRKTPDKIYLDLIDPGQQTYVDAVEPKANIDGQPIRPRELMNKEFSGDYGPRVVTEMARCHKFRDPDIKLYPFQLEADKAGDRAVLFMGTVENPKYESGYQQVAVYSYKLSGGTRYKIQPFFCKGLGRWVFLAYDGQVLTLLFTGRRTNGETQLYQPDDEELAGILRELGIEGEYSRLRPDVIPRPVPPAGPIEPAVVPDGQGLYEEIKRITHDGEYAIPWSAIAERKKMDKRDLVKMLVVYLAQVYSGDLDKMAKALWMTVGSFKAHIIYKYRLMQEAKGVTTQPQPQTGPSPIEKYIADGFEKGEFKGLSSLKAIVKVCQRFGIKRRSNEYKDVARLYFTYKFFEYLKGLRKELDEGASKRDILLKLNRDYMQKYYNTLLCTLVRYYEFNYRNVFTGNKERISEILGFEIDYQRDIWKCPPSEIRNWIFDTSGKVQPPAGFDVVIDESRSYTLSNSKDLYIRLTGVDPGVYSASFEEGLDKKDKYICFRKGDKLIQRYQLVKESQILAQKINRVKTGLSPIALIVTDHSQIIRDWILEKGPIPPGKEVEVKKYGAVIICGFTDLFIKCNTGLFPLAGQRLWATFEEDESGENKFVLLWKDTETAGSDPYGYLRKFYIVRDGVPLSIQNKRPPLLYTFRDEDRIIVRGETLRRKRIKDGEHIELLVSELSDPDVQATKNALDALKWVNTSSGLDKVGYLLNHAVINPKIKDETFRFLKFIVSRQTPTDEMLEEEITGYPGIRWDPNRDKNKLRNMMNTLHKRGVQIDRDRLNGIYYRLLFLQYLRSLVERYRELPLDRKKRTVCIELAPKNLDFYDRLVTYCGDYSNLFTNYASIITEILGFSIDYAQDIHKYTKKPSTRESLIDWLIGQSEDIPKGNEITIGKNGIVQLINTKDIRLSFSADLAEYAGKRWATYEVVGDDKLIIIWPSKDEAEKKGGQYIRRVYLVKDAVCLAQVINGEKTGRKPVVAEEESYRQVGDKRLKESEIAKGLHNEYLLRCLGDYKTREAAKDALKLMRNEERLIDFLRALDPLDPSMDAVNRNLIILEILEVIGIANDRVFKRLRDFMGYGNAEVRDRAIEVFRKFKRLQYLKEDKVVLSEYRKGPQYLTNEEISEIESPITNQKLHGKELIKFKGEFPPLDKKTIEEELGRARGEGLEIGELRTRFKRLVVLQKPPPPKRPSQIELLKQSAAFVRYCDVVAGMKRLTEAEKLAKVKEKFPDKSDEHILNHLRRASARIERETREEDTGDESEVPKPDWGDDDDNGNDPNMYMRARSMRDVYALASLRYRLFYDFDLSLHDYDLILQDIETLIRFDLSGEPIPQSINRTNLMLLRQELRRKGQNQRLVLFSTIPKANISKAMDMLGIPSGTEVITREDYEHLVEGPMVAPALLGYVNADRYTHVEVLTIEEKYYLWQGILDIVMFVDNRRYPVDGRLRNELRRIGLENVIQNDPRYGYYIDLSHEVPVLEEIEVDRLMARIIEDEA